MQKAQHKDKHIATHSNSTSNSENNDFRLERYKYILEELKALNENTHKCLALFQTLATAIISGGIGIFIAWHGLNINADVARIAVQGAIGLLILLALFVIVSIIANICSWFDYRKEEVELLNEFITPSFRKSPQLRNFWRWSETYVLIFITISTAIIYFYIEYQILPLIK